MAIYGNMVVPSKAAGGALPTDNSDRNVYVPGTEVSARYSDAGGVLAAQGAQKAAEGLGNLGKGLGALGSMGLAFYTRQRRIEHAEAMEAVARLQTEYVEKQREWSQIKGANAINMEELKSRWWDEAIPRYTQNLSDYGKRYFNLNADRVGAQADTFIQHHQEQQINQYETTQLKVAMDSEANMINLDPYNQQQTSASIGRIQALIHQDCLRKGLPPEVEQQMVRQAVGTAFGNAIAIQIQQGRLDGAQQLFAQYQQIIPADQQAKLLDAYDSNARQLGAAQAANGDMRGLERTMRGGVPYTARGGESGSLLRRYESTGLDDISIDTGGSKSYGPYQFNSGAGHRGGTMHQWVSGTRTSDPEIYKRLSPYRVGSKEFDAAFKALAADPAMRERLSLSMRQGFLDMYENPALRGINGSEYAAKFAGNPVFREVMDSTAVQHGPGMVRNIFDKAWSRTDKTGSEQQILSSLISNIYQERQAPGRFKRAAREDPQIYAKMGRRYSSENAVAQRLLADYYRTGSMPQVQGLNVGAGGQPMSAQDKMAQRAAAGLPAEAPAGSGASAGAGGSSPQGNVPQPQSGGIQGLGMKPDTLLHFQSVLAPQAMANSMWKELEALPADKLDYEYDKRMQALQKENPVMASKVDSLVRPMVKRQKDIYKAESEQRVGDWGVKVKGLDPLAVRDTLNKAVAAGQITEEEAAKVYDRTVGSKRTPSTENREAVVEIKRLIDRGARGEKGGITERGQVESAAINGRLTDAQTNDCLEYLDKGGQRSIVDVTRIEKVWKQYREDQGESVSSKDKIPPALVDFVYADMTPGKIPSTQELRNSIAKGYIRGKAMFGKNYAYEAAAKGDKDWFDARMTDDDWKNVTKWIETNWPDVKKPYTFALMKEASRKMQGMPWGVKNEKQGGVR